MLPTLDDIRRARDRLAGLALRTPLVRLDLGKSPMQVWLKLESLQPIASFKIRGAANAIARRSPGEIAAGLLTASAGNMAQGVAWCARQRGLPCTVIAPDTAPATKLAAIERLGARVIREPFERWWQTFQDRAYPGVQGAFIHAFDDLDVMAGNGTIGLEIHEDLPDVDAVVVPWGGRRPRQRDRSGNPRPRARLPRLRRRMRNGGAACRGTRSRATDIRRIPSHFR